MIARHWDVKTFQLHDCSRPTKQLAYVFGPLQQINMLEVTLDDDLQVGVLLLRPVLVR